MRFLVLGALGVLVLLCLTRTALAQDHPTLNGSWSATALTERWNIGDWGEACGPKPKPQGAGGGSVQVREQGGELSIVGAGRAWSTAECWEQMPGLSRSSHSASGGGRFWRTRCGTPKNDPRQATIVTTTQASDTSISMNETGQYQFVIQDQNCTAAVTRSRSYSLVKREGDEPSPAASASAAPSATPSAAPATTPTRPPPKVCTGTPGDPARLEVTPSRKLLRPGDRFAFRAIVLDGEGCPVPVKPAWSIAPGPLASKASVDPTGGVKIADDAGEGKVELSASVAGKGVTIAIEVASADHYDALLAVSGLNDAGEADEAAVAVIATGTIGGKATAVEDSAKGRKQAFVAIVAALAAALGFAGFILMRRGRGARAASIPEGATRDSSGFLADDAEVGSGEPSAPGDPTASVAVPSGGAEPSASSGPRKRGKICPTCGQRYAAEAEFCGKDGTSLVLIN